MLAAVRRAVLAIDRATTGAVTVAACCAMVFAAGLACYQIFMRYVVGRPSAWSEPALQMFVIWMVYLGCAATFRKGALVSVDVVYRLAPPRLRLALDAVVFVSIMVLLGHMVRYGWEMTQRAAFNVNPTLDISMSWGFAAVPVGAAFAMVAVVAHYLDPARREQAAPTD